jgi:hypothetical protein
MRYVSQTVLLAGAMICSLDTSTRAAEGGIGVYLMGSRSDGAGITPPSGVYSNDDTNFYDAKIGLPFGGFYREFDAVNHLDTNSHSTPGKMVEAKF